MVSLHCKSLFLTSYIYYFHKQEPEIEYVEGYEELEEEDDMEDFGGLAIKESDEDDDNGIVLSNVIWTWHPLEGSL